MIRVDIDIEHLGTQSLNTDQVIQSTVDLQPGAVLNLPMGTVNNADLTLFALIVHDGGDVRGNIRGGEIRLENKTDLKKRVTMLLGGNS